MSTTKNNYHEKTTPVRFITVADYAQTFAISYPSAIKQYKADLLAIADLLGLCPSHRHRLTNYDLFRLYGLSTVKRGKRR